MKLTVKQKKFADAYIRLGNATQAAIEAGYSAKTADVIGAQNLGKLSVKSYIDERMTEVSNKRIMSATEALELLSRIARGEEMETVVVGTAQGAETVERPPDNKQKMAAAKELLKRFPDNDRLLDAQVRKMEADADISEAKAKLLNDDRVALETKIVIGEYDE
ncbi:terminase small subunit [Weissella confusa]|uniref:terminase small subunit n=1 Tax=Weissella confusa TaxID=1583 RepID=UPI001C6FB31B|nr:terminase small subunit [Weissella confusa]QYU58200.1 terminase small subunit [Weissella confusa]